MRLNIAILGTRGIPNHYGGFEHFAAQLSKRLVQKGHAVTVYNSSRHPYRHKEWNGVQLIHCFDPENIIGIAGQFIYDLNCILDARKKNYDIALMLGYTSSSVFGSLFPRNAVVITNMDGLEWQRSKYSRPVQMFLKYAEKLAVRAGDHHIADSLVIQQYIHEKYQVSCRYIAYGAELDPVRDESVLGEYALEKKQYFLLMARMEPENNVEAVLDGFVLAGSPVKFLVIGDTKPAFGKVMLKKFRNNKNIVFAGAIFDDRKTQSLTAFCSMYFHGHSVGGTNPSLLDAMAAKVPICAHDNLFNRSVLARNSIYFRDKYDVADAIGNGDFSGETLLKNNFDTVCRQYSWELIAQQYENYFIACSRRQKFSPPAYQPHQINIHTHEY